MHRMTMAEAVSYMRGQDRRCRQQWEQTRELAGLVYKVLTGEEYNRPFPWDDENDNPKVMTLEEQHEMWDKARQMEKIAGKLFGNL